jgi:beta-lactamase regulating signal transducer with metallopeptidase domain
MSLWAMSLYGAVMIIAIVILRALLINQLPKKTFLILWGIVMVRLVIPFTAPSAFSIYSLIPEKEQSMNTQFSGIQDNLSENLPVNAMADTVHVDKTTQISIKWLVWLAGLCLCAGYFLIVYRKLYREFQMSFLVKIPQIEQWLVLHNGKRRIEIRQSDRVAAPVSYGIIHPIILFPKNTDWENMNVLQYVLEHEYVHIKRYDSITKLLVTAIMCIHWFNPMVWVMYILFNRDLELACDECVIHRFGNNFKSTYAHALISMEEQKSGFMPFCNNFSKNAIEERITAIMKTKKTTIVMLVASAIVIIGVTGTFATSANASAKIDNKNSEYIESTIAKDVMLAYNDEDGNIYYSADGGETFFNEKEFNEKYPSPEVEWWTYEEYKEWLDNERIQLQSMLGEKAWTGGRGEFVWTQEMIDETIACYEEILQKIDNGVKVSKTVDGSEEIQIATYDDKEHFMESVEGAAIASDKETKVFGPYDTKEELLDAIKSYCEEQVRLGNMTQQAADEIIEKYE